MSATGSRGAWSETHHAGVMVPEPHPRFHSLAERIEWEEHEKRMAKATRLDKLADDEEESE